MLKLIDSDIKGYNHLFFAFKLSFFLLKIVYSFILSLDLFIKSFDFFKIFLFDSLNDLFFVFLMTHFNLIHHILDTCKVGVKQVNHFAL